MSIHSAIAFRAESRGKKITLCTSSVRILTLVDPCLLHPPGQRVCILEGRAHSAFHRPLALICFWLNPFHRPIVFVGNPQPFGRCDRRLHAAVWVHLREMHGRPAPGLVAETRRPGRPGDPHRGWLRLAAPEIGFPGYFRPTSLVSGVRDA